MGKITEVKGENFDYDKFFLNFNIPYARHQRIIKSIEPLKKKIEKKGKLWAVMHTEFTTCPHCEHPIMARDDKRGEFVCEGCGTVSGTGIKLSNNNEVEENRETSPLNSSDRYTKQEQEFVKKTTNRQLKQCNKQSWRKTQYIMQIGILNTSLMMNKNQKDKIKFIINKYSLRSIHGNADYMIIIAGVCRYILIKDGRGKELRFNREPFNLVGLTKQNYKIIKTNLDKLQVL